MAEDDEAPATKVEVASPKDTSAVSDGCVPSLRGSLEARADPDAQNTVTDFIDFTEYLPADIMRSLTLIGKLDERYRRASLTVDDLTATWARLPSMPACERPEPRELRAEISRHLKHAVDSRTFAHTEAVRMADNVSRHHRKAEVLLEKLQTMLQNYPAQQDLGSPTEPRSPQVARAVATAKPAVVRPTGEDGKKISRRKVPRITVPGEVLAPYDIEYDTFSDGSDTSTDDDDDTVTSRRTPGPPKIKLLTSRGGPPKTIRSARSISFPPAVMSAAAAANAAALLRPPPDNAVAGSRDAPWLQLTDYELAVLRKRMKKNAAWAPSETMIARELKSLGRGPEAYRDAKKRAEDEGRVFDAQVPTFVRTGESGPQQLPAGAISAECLDSSGDFPTSNKGMKLNEAKKLKREALAKQAAEEAEESERKMREAAQLFMAEKSSGREGERQQKSKAAAVPRTGSRTRPKRKRDDGGGDGNEEADTLTLRNAKTPRNNAKRTRIETPVPPPRHASFHREASNNSAVTTPASNTVTPTATTQTPVPIPIYTRSSAASSVTPSMASAAVTPALAAAAAATDPSTSSNTITTTVPLKPPAQTPVPLPRTEQRLSVTPVYPPARGMPPREAKRAQMATATTTQTQATSQTPGHVELGRRRSASRGLTPVAEPSRRPGSRGGGGGGGASKVVASQEGVVAVVPPTPSSSSSQTVTLASERTRRASTTRYTPGAPLSGGDGTKSGAMAAGSTGRRTRRPAPGVVSTTSSGGNSAVGKRKAAPRKKARATKKDRGGGGGGGGGPGTEMEAEMEEVDDEGNPIDASEPRYCNCNRVSFGTMIQCENSENCKYEWFHLECVGLEEVPARTTKWYCPGCRKTLNIGEKGEVNARGVRK